MATEFADSNRGRIAYQLEVAFGEQNGAFAGQTSRITSSGLVANKGTTVSDELRADRMVSDLIETDFSTGGDMGAEWSLGGTWDEFLLAALCSPVTQLATTYSATTLTITAPNTVTSSSGSEFTPTQPGDWIWLSGFSNAVNNGWKQVETASTGSVTVITPDLEPLMTEGGAVQPDGVNTSFINSTFGRSYNVEQYFEDINIAQMFVGQRVGTWSLDVSSGAVVTATWGFMGTAVTAQTGAFDASPDDATTTDVVGATANVAVVAINGEPVNCEVQSISLNLDNGLRVQNAVGDKFPCGIGYGRQTITGSLTVYFQNLDDYNDFLNHTDVEIWWTFQDNAGNSMRIKIPRAKYTSGSPALEGIDTDVTLTLDFQALAAPNVGTGVYRQIEIGNFTVA